MRDRTKEVEKLKKQLQQLQEIVSGDPSTTPPPEHELASGGRSPASSEGTPASLAEPGPVAATTPAADGSRQVGDYMQAWPQSHAPEQLNGLGLIADGDTPMAFEASPTYYSHIPASNDVVPELPATSSLGRRSRAVTTAIAPGSIPQHHPPPRSHSMSAAYSSNCPSPLPWGVSGAEGQEALPLSAGCVPIHIYNSVLGLTLMR